MKAQVRRPNASRVRRQGRSGAPTATGRSLSDVTRPEALQRVVVVGLGFAGLPTAVAIAEAGLPTVGLDIDATKVARINAGQDVSGVAGDLLRQLAGEGLIHATTDPSVIREAEIIVISVPTPLDDAGRPDERILSAACQSVVENVSHGALVVLQSTVVPGATRRLLVQPLEAAGRVVGRDIFVAYSPERINPGDPIFTISNTPKLVAGATEACLNRGRSFIASFVSSVEAVPALEVAELAKLVENTFRFINISFVNEVAVLCDRLGIRVWDVINAAATKPFAFMAHHPGAGIGGDCVPVSPRYLQASALAHGLESEIISAGFRATGAMPSHVVDRCAAELGADLRDLRGVRILVVGLAYKPGVADTRHSPAVPVIRMLCQRGAAVTVHDPLVEEIYVDGVRYGSVDLEAEGTEGGFLADAAIVITPHPSIDYKTLGSKTGLILDTRNALAAGYELSGRVVPL